MRTNSSVYCKNASCMHGRELNYMSRQFFKTPCIDRLFSSEGPVFFVCLSVFDKRLSDTTYSPLAEFPCRIVQSDEKSDCF